MSKDSNEKEWFALYTKPRWEKKIHAALLKKSVESWCPVQKVQKQWSDRKKIIEDPLFKSYVFVHITQQERLKTLQTDGVLNFVYYLGKPAVIRLEEIELIKMYLMQKDVSISVHSFDSFEKDMQIRIKQGVFMDIEGTIVRKSGKRKAYVSLQSLGQVMVVEFPLDHLEPI